MVYAYKLLRYRNSLYFYYTSPQRCFMNHVIRHCSCMAGITTTWILSASPTDSFTKATNPGRHLLWTPGEAYCEHIYQASINALSFYREWFKQSCLNLQTPSSTTDDSMCQLLLQLLKESESIQVISSR